MIGHTFVVLCGASELNDVVLRTARLTECTRLNEKLIQNCIQFQPTTNLC